MVLRALRFLDDEIFWMWWCQWVFGGGSGRFKPNALMMGTLWSAMLMLWVSASVSRCIVFWGFGLKYSKWRTEEQRVKMRVQDQVIITAFYIFIFIFKHSFSQPRKARERKRKQNTQARYCSHMHPLNKRIGQ